MRERTRLRGQTQPRESLAVRMARMGAARATATARALEHLHREEARARRSLAAIRGWQTRAEKEVLTPLLARLLQLRHEGATSFQIKEAHGRWYGAKIGMKQRVGQSRYEAIVEAIGAALDVHNIQAYIDS